MKHYLHYFIFSASFLGSISCGSKKTPEPGILSQPEMVRALTDVYIAEQKVIALNLSRDSATALFKKLNAKVLDSLHIQDSVLKKSYNYYLDRPKELEQIFTSLVDSLNLREQRATSEPGKL